MKIYGKTKRTLVQAVITAFNSNKQMEPTMAGEIAYQFSTYNFKIPLHTIDQNKINRYT